MSSGFPALCGAQYIPVGTCGIILELGFGDEKQVAGKRKLYLQGLLVPSGRLQGDKVYSPLPTNGRKGRGSHPKPLPSAQHFVHTIAFALSSMLLIWRYAALSHRRSSSMFGNSYKLTHTAMARSSGTLMPGLPTSSAPLPHSTGFGASSLILLCTPAQCLTQRSCSIRVCCIYERMSERKFQ